jgi:hypothetical protein
MHKVTKKEFFEEIGPKNVHPQVIASDFPRTSIFKTPRGFEVGRIVSYLPRVKGLPQQDYFIK